MSVISQSACLCCYDGDTQFPTFAECWCKNPVAHMFPDKTKMKKGAFKTCFMGVLGAAGHDLLHIKRNIHKFMPMLGVQDIVTCIELGVDHRKDLFDFNNHDRVTVVSDVLRKALINQQGVLRSCNIGCSIIEMADVLEKDIRQVTKGSIVQVIQKTSPLYMYKCIAKEDGSLCGWCAVHVNSNTYIIPTMWVQTIHAEQPRDSNWERKACVNILYEQVVPTHPAGSSIRFTGEGVLNVTEMIQIFDPDSMVTPKIFAAFDTNIRDWNDQGQKDALLDSMCELHARNPLQYFVKESISPDMNVFFNWEGCVGTQSVFESNGPYLFCVDNTNPHVSSQALIGWCTHALGEIQWEIPHNRRISNIEHIRQRNEGLMVQNSSVTHRHDSTRTGRIVECIDSATTCLVEWKHTGSGVSVRAREAFVDLERSVLTQQVVMPPGLVWGKVQDYPEHAPPTYVYVSFRGATSIADDMCGAWFNLKHLDDQRLRHQLQTYLSYPWRKARFFVQERVGESFASIVSGQSELILKTYSAFCNFRDAIAFFCRGAARMHQQNISHNDLHNGNLTITQTADGESFAVKMIDFDRMKQHAEHAESLQFRKDVFCIVTALYELVEKAQCLILCPCVRRKCVNEIDVLLDFLDTVKNTVEGMSLSCTSSTTADFLVKIATKVGQT